MLAGKVPVRGSRWAALGAMAVATLLAAMAGSARADHPYAREAKPIAPGCVRLLQGAPNTSRCGSLCCVGSASPNVKP